jgi:hypothetical protein
MTDNKINYNDDRLENPPPNSTHWKVSGSQIDFDIDQRIYWEGDLSGKGSMSGKAWSGFVPGQKNTKWDWEATLFKN